jgi:hypothetical protein
MRSVIERRVGREHGDSGPRQLEGHGPRHERLLGLEEDRVIRDDRVAAVAARLLDDVPGAIDREKNAGQRRCGVADEQTDIVPRGGKPRGRDRFHRHDEIRHDHRGERSARAEQGRAGAWQGAEPRLASSNQRVRPRTADP